jgi:hypothetical protein
MFKDIHMFIVILLIAIAILSLKLINNRVEVTTELDDKNLKDSIAVLNDKLNKSFAKELELIKENDSLKSIEQQVIYRTNERIKFIFSTTDPSVLDSIIRAGWKTK